MNQCTSIVAKSSLSSELFQIWKINLNGRDSQIQVLVSRVAAALPNAHEHTITECHHHAYSRRIGTHDETLED